MNSFIINNYSLSDNILSIEICKKLQGYNEIHLKNRKTEEVIKIDTKQRLLNNIFSIDIDLEELPIMNNDQELVFLDVFIKLNDELLRVSSPSNVSVKEKHRFSKNVYKISNVNVLVPYLTKKNNFSFIYGDCSLIFDKYVDYVFNYESIALNKDGSVHLPFLEMNVNNIFISTLDSKKKWEYHDFFLSKKDEIFKLIIDEKISSKAMHLMIKSRNVMIATKIIKKTSNQELSLNHEKRVIKSVVEIEKIIEKNKQLQLILKNVDLNQYNNIKLIAKNRANKDEFKQLNCDIKKVNDKILLSLNLNEHELKAFNTSKTERWDIYLELETNSFVELARLNYLFNENVEKYNNFFNFQDINEKVASAFYLTLNNNLSFVIKNKYLLTSESIDYKAKLIDMKKKRNSISGEVFIDIKGVEEYDVESFSLVYRNEKEDKIIDFPVVVERDVKSKKSILFEISNLKKNKMEQYYWDSFIRISLLGKKYFLRVSNQIDNIISKIEASESYCELKVSDHLFFPYITQNNNLSFVYRERSIYDNFLNRLKVSFASFLYKNFSKYFDKKEIWLVYEKDSQVAQDNGYYFFKYLQENKLKKNVFFLIDKRSKDMKRLKKYKSNIIKFLSLKHMVYLLASELMIGSESRGHAYKNREIRGQIVKKLNEKEIVFLQHGVLGFKKVDRTFNKESKNGVDLFVVSSQFEANIVKEHFNYSSEDILLTGLSRWDELEDTSTQTEQKTIFFMPTWRSWLEGCTAETFVNSQYFKEYSNIFNSKELSKMLENNNIRLVICLHPRFKEFVDYFDINHKLITIFKFGEIPVNEMIRKSSLLITDYSSVSWDFYYLRKPVIFYQFDFDEYKLHQGSYIDMKKGIFGDRVTDSNELLSVIESYVNNKFTEKDKFAQQRSKYFEYVDKMNAKRTFELIKEKKLK